MSSAPNAQVLPSFDLSLQPDHYRTTLPNLSYPSRSNAHISWSGSSAPLLFAVSQIFFFVFCHRLTSDFRRPCVLNRQSPQVLPLYKLVVLFNLIVNLTLTLILHQFQPEDPPTTPTNLDTYSVPDAFQGISALIWVRLTSVLSTFPFWFLFFSLQHNLSIIIRKIKLIPQRFFGIGFTSPSATASV